MTRLRAQKQQPVSIAQAVSAASAAMVRELDDVVSRLAKMTPDEQQPKEKGSKEKGSKEKGSKEQRSKEKGSKEKGWVIVNDISVLEEVEGPQYC